MIRIVMADDHAIVRTGFRALIEEEAGFCIVAECDDAATARVAVQGLLPDVLVLDLSLPGGGLGLISELRIAQPQVSVLVLSMHDSEPWLSEALGRGAAGYVSKGAAPRELLEALHAVASGQSYLSSDLNRASSPAGLESLTERERDVFLRLARGQTPKQIALEQGVSDKTVYQQRTSLRAKLGVKSDLEIHRRALELGLLSRQ
nr:response regulator transcription factor [uncultured Stenotrophomonas sp.]